MKMDPRNVLDMLSTGHFSDISADPDNNGNFDEALKALGCIMPVSGDLFSTADDNK
ncbi:hypothetical protein [Cytobacillus praedii]|uniref:hypothetical protein n=1 Tax=Cytobacillus praedii TaxID=1742358 RepID=UPI00399CFAD3